MGYKWTIAPSGKMKRRKEEAGKQVSRHFAKVKVKVKVKGSGQERDCDQEQTSDARCAKLDSRTQRGERSATTTTPHRPEPVESTKDGRLP